MCLPDNLIEQRTVLVLYVKRRAENFPPRRIKTMHVMRASVTIVRIVFVIVVVAKYLTISLPNDVTLVAVAFGHQALITPVSVDAQKLLHLKFDSCAESHCTHERNGRLLFEIELHIVIYYNAFGIEQLHFARMNGQVSIDADREMRRLGLLMHLEQVVLHNPVLNFAFLNDGARTNSLKHPTGLHFVFFLERFDFTAQFLNPLSGIYTRTRQNAISSTPQRRCIHASHLRTRQNCAHSDISQRNDLYMQPVSV
jgi:hypothetical protein